MGEDWDSCSEEPLRWYVADDDGNDMQGCHHGYLDGYDR